VQRIEQGELISFCNDFGFKMPKSKLMNIFKMVSPLNLPLNLEQFKQALPLISLEYCKNGAKEMKYRL